MKTPNNSLVHVYSKVDDVGTSEIKKQKATNKIMDEEKIRKSAQEDLVIANKEIAFQNDEKEKRAEELNIANKELVFQNGEKDKRAAELIIANKELAFQNGEKEKRAAELIIANKELAFQNNEKEKRADELIQAKLQKNESDLKYKTILSEKFAIMDSFNNQASDPNKVLEVLMLEDNDNDVELLQMFLKSSALITNCTVVSTKEDYVKALEEKEFDVILSDHNIPQFGSLEALKIRNKLKFHIPFILVSGTIPEEYAVTILQAGANDYILKDRPQRLVVAITEAIKKQKAIADRILAEEELLQTNERLKLVGKATTDAIWDWNIISNEVYRGEGFQKLFGYNLSDKIYDLKKWTDNIHPDDVNRVRNSIEKFLNSKKTNWQEEFRYIKADGTIATVLEKGLALRDEIGKAYRMVGATQDLTHVRKLEIEIHDQKLNHQKENTKIAIQSQEQERSNIGRELHDNINQLLANAKMMIDTARNSPEIHDLCISKSHEAITMAIDEVRKLSHSLVAPSFTEGDTFIDAVNDLVENINLSGKLDISLNIPTNGQFKLSNEKIKLTFYRVIQEQLNNILKYAKATEASIALHVLQNGYQLIITDNGIGFDVTKKNKGIGIRNMQNRVELLSGSMEIISATGKGCILKALIPFSVNASDLSCNL